MRTIHDTQILLGKLDMQPADSLEDQDLDFKEWNIRSMNDSIALVIEMAVCMANGGGGTVVFGVNDKKTGQAQAIKGVPPDIDINRLKKAVYDSTDPRLTPVFEEMAVPYGTGRLIVMQIFPGLPPYTDSSGRGKIRIGKDCQPLTGSMRSRIMAEIGDSDFTRETVSENLDLIISPAAMEILRDTARREQAPDELLQLSDSDLISALGLIRDGKPVRAAFLLAGKESSIKKHFPSYVWTFLKMSSDTEYSDRIDGNTAIPVAVMKIIDRIMADNPITTVKQGLFHFEYRTYPEIALREAIMNAFCHSDYRIPGPILIKHFPDRIEINSPGGFIGGISSQNILHHSPVSRNPQLVDALTRLRLVNRSNLGVHRMFHAMLIEGKKPPEINETGQAVTVCFTAENHSAEFREFVANEGKKGIILTIDQLLIFHYLLDHPEIDTATAAHISQRKDIEAREILNQMEIRLNYLERGGTGKGTYWKLRVEFHKRISTTGHLERDSRIDWDAAKTRILSVLKQRSEHDNAGISNAEIRQISYLDRNQVFRIMKQLIKEELSVKLSGKGRYARYFWKKTRDKE